MTFIMNNQNLYSVNLNLIINNLINMIIIILLVFLMYKSIVKSIENFSDTKYEKNTDDPFNTALLLTTCINPKKDFLKKEKSEDPEREREKDIKERFDMYKKIINKYLEKTNLKLHIIESSNSNLLGEFYKDNDRISYHTFQLDKPVFFNNIENNSTSSFEAYSILKAYQAFRLDKYDKILKVTGRYYIPNVENIINSFEDRYDLYVQSQSHDDHRSQRSEIFGMKSNICPGIMIGTIRSKTLIESYIYNLYKKWEENPYPPYVHQRIPLIHLDEPVFRGGDGEKITEL